MIDGGPYDADKAYKDSKVRKRFALFGEFFKLEHTCDRHDLLKT